MAIVKTYHFFLFFTFALHFCFITLLVGTPWLALLERLRGRTGGPAWSFWRTHYPICISLTITTGIAPFLFSQTLFHRSFYQTFINLYPLPLVGLVMLIVFFYLAYLIKHVDRLALPLTFVQICFLFSFMLFFGMLYNSMLHPENLSSDYWNDTWPPLLWHSFGGYVLAAIVGCACFYGLHRHPWRRRAIPLLIIGFLVSTIREVMRLHTLGNSMPAPLIEQLDISVAVFLLFFLIMIGTLLYAFKVAFPAAVEERD